MIFYFATLTNRIKGVLLLSATTWKTIKKESGYVIETLVFLFASCLLSGLLSLIESSTWLAEIYIPFISILITSVIIRFFKLIKKINWETNFNLLVYSFSPLLWCYSLSFVIRYRQILLPFGLLYSLVLLFISIKTVIGATVLQTLSLLLKITVTTFLCLYLMMVFFSDGHL